VGLLLSLDLPLIVSGRSEIGASARVRDLQKRPFGGVIWYWDCGRPRILSGLEVVAGEVDTLQTRSWRSTRGALSVGNRLGGLNGWLGCLVAFSRGWSLSSSHLPSHHCSPKSLKRGKIGQRFSTEAGFCRYQKSRKTGIDGKSGSDSLLEGNFTETERQPNWTIGTESHAIAKSQRCRYRTEDRLKLEQGTRVVGWSQRFRYGFTSKNSDGSCLLALSPSLTTVCRGLK